MQEVIVTKMKKDDVADELIKFAVISAKYDGKWVFVRDKERTTLEITGGHREDGETVLESAHRELYEETGAVDYTLDEVCTYRVTIDGVASYGTLFFANVKEFGDIPEEFETAERIYLDTLPQNLTYPQIQPSLYKYTEEWLSKKADMKTYAPDYYNDFKCIADKCKNSCCIGWEIDIDDNTYKKYMSLNSPIGEKLRKNITEELPHSFKLRENEKCPFLNENGLCELILELGEDSLCDICALHPRFRNFYNTRTEIGLGLCCEAVVEIILSKTTPTSLIVIDDDGETDVTDEAEEEIIELRDNILSLLSDRMCSLDERVKTLLESFALPDAVLKLSEFQLVFSSLEYMSPISKTAFSSLSDEKTLTDIEVEQLLNYFIYRYVANSIDDAEIRAYLAFALLSISVISALAKIMPKPEACRLYSSEIEYNEDNVEKIIDKIYEIIGE